jgi:hypothetical protein
MVVSDGTPKGTRIVNADTREPIIGVESVTWSCSADSEADALIHLIGVPCEITAKAGMMLIDDSFPVGDEPGDYIDISQLLKSTHV